jgi:hypothetical protein
MKEQICADPECRHKDKFHLHKKGRCSVIVSNGMYKTDCPCKKFKLKKDEKNRN